MTKITKYAGEREGAGRSLKEETILRALKASGEGNLAAAVVRTFQTMPAISLDQSGLRGKEEGEGVTEG